MTSTPMNLFDAIKKHQLPLIDEDYYKNNFYYKQFVFNEDQVDKAVDMFAKVEYTLLHHDLKYYLLMDKKLIDAQDALIKACDDLYSERLRYNTELKQVVEMTMVPYYHGRFQINFSREISFLPLELRLYIYTRLLAVEASTFRQMHLVDRIALTLHKAGEHFLGDCAIFISAWLKSKLSIQVTGRKQSFEAALNIEKKSIQNVVGLRKQILSEAEMTPETAWPEFWYGLKSFSSLSNIHNVEAAKICLEIFTTYYQKSFSHVNDMYPLIKNYYETRNPNEINQFIQKVDLDSVSIVRRYTQVSYHDQEVNAMTAEEIEELDYQQKRYAQRVMNNQKENRYLFLNTKGLEVKEMDLEVPEIISESHASKYLRKLAKILHNKRITLLQFNQYLLDLTTAMMNDESWDLKKLNIVIGALGELYSVVWLRNSSQDSTALLKALNDILEEKPNVVSSGKGWPTGLVLQDGNNKKRTCLLFHSTNINFPEFTGHFYVGENPTSYKNLAIEKAFLENRCMRVYWIRIEKYLNAPKSIQKKHSNFWKKVRKAREEAIALS